MATLGQLGRFNILTLGCLTLALPLALYAWTGTNLRYTGDDYCYAGLFRQHGFWETIRSTYLGPSPFHGNRYSLTFFSGLAGVIGPTASAILPALSILILVGGSMYAFVVGARAFSIRLTLPQGLLAAEGLAFYGFTMSPELTQSLYWRSGTLPYLMPLVTITLLAGVMLTMARREPPTPIHLGLVLGLALMAGGFSETATAMQLTIMLLAVVLAVRARRGNNRPLPGAVTVATAALIGSIFALVLLAVSPATQYTLSGLDQATSAARLLRLSGFHAYLFLHGIAFRQALPALAVFAVFLWLGLNLAWGNQGLTTSSWRRYFVVGLVIGLSWLASVFATMMPSAYAQSSYPPGRALITAAFASALGIAGFGALAGHFVASHVGKRELTRLAATLLLLAAVTIVPFSASRSTLLDLPKYQRWSRFWDARDLQIRELRSLGHSEVEVVLIDKIIPDVAELQPDPDYWYNNCAEWYYDLDRLSANLPGWDS